MSKLNNKGYMLVEIVLASVIAFGVAYFILNLTIKLKNKNDDMLVETQVMTDQAIIANKLMKYIISEGSSFDCNKIVVSDKKITYKDKNNVDNIIDVASEFANVSGPTIIKCDNTVKSFKINISVPQMEKNFDVLIDYKL